MRSVPTRRQVLAGGVAALASQPAGGTGLGERHLEASMSAQGGGEMTVGIVGCSEGTHGKVWGEMLAGGGASRFGMRPTRVWDADPAAAAALARTTGATAVARSEDAGSDVDGILITELNPDRYLSLSRPFLMAGKRIFYNRPFAGSVRDATAIVELARKHDARIYSASALYHTAAGEKARESLAKIGPVRLFNVVGPTDHLGFYLPHAIASLVSVLGTGIARVQAVSLHPKTDSPRLADGPVVVYVEYGVESPIGPARGVVEMVGPAAKWYGFVLKVFGADAEADEVHFEVSYDKLLETMAGFFRTGVEPIPHNVILEKTAILYAALESARRGGKPIDLTKYAKPSAA